ncbi:hypothetical protein LNP25_28200 [Klebsiella variicola subsp. variicola]|nr:hypothetical protein [Klebsiella variicola subsp. variicola]
MLENRKMMMRSIRDVRAASHCASGALPELPPADPARKLAGG